ncbi:MAG: YwbE family protein [Nitrosopumilaceae archaeon]|nr:YwbE family protein [Nitrosopumilaceae archaeon]
MADPPPVRDQIRRGCKVGIETKADQGTGRLTGGTVGEILTSSKFHPHGIKVRLEDGRVGRVKELRASGILDTSD